MFSCLADLSIQTLSQFPKEGNHYCVRCNPINDLRGFAEGKNFAYGGGGGAESQEKVAAITIIITATVPIGYNDNIKILEKYNCDILRSAKRLVRGYEKFVPALAYLFCLPLPESCLSRFAYHLADLCIFCSLCHCI